ncbi:TrmH family RNA methyltransferase [Beduini massiliensis]|uniref:TrmH family RNA methyltransferase n=1 Tax=Beduini massiliensis TaxID=1585974 RepID=UPI00059A7AA6|nr:RNA methyltransferase [Beduini massiliensis]
MKITSVNNPKIKEIMKLKKKKYRDQQQRYLVEGEHLVEEALKAGVAETILALSPVEHASVDVIEVSDDIISRLSSVETPQPIIAVCKMQGDNSLMKEGKRYLLLDDLQDPGNIGTLVRTAVAFGYDQVILGLNSVDLYNDKFIRASQGGIFYIHCIKQDLKTVISQLQNDGVSVYGTSLLNGKAIQEVNFQERLAILLGNEGNGVSEDLLSLTDQNIYIPIVNAESLNVAIAGGILMYHYSK